MKKGLIAALIIIAALGGGALYQHSKSNSAKTNNGANAMMQKDSASSTDSSAISKIDIKSMMFTPSQISVAKGATVTWTNNDNVAHTIIDDLSTVSGPKSSLIQPGASYSFTFAKAGSYQYHCSIHPSMRGTIVVK